MRRKNQRKQRVVLRLRRREQLKHRIGGALARGAALTLGAGLALGMICQSDSLRGDFLRRHTPVLEVRTPQALAGQPVSIEWPKRRYWLWAPGVELKAGSRLRRKNPAIRAVHFEKDFSANRMIVRIEPRMPLVRCGNGGMDREGVVFPIVPGSWSQLPSAHFSPGLARPALGRWLAALAKQEPFWSQVVSISDDPYGNMLIDLKTGARVNWGPPEPGVAGKKLAAVSEVLEDAHRHLGGAAQADLRFFDQGRIMMRPKSAKSLGSGEGSWRKQIS